MVDSKEFAVCIFDALARRKRRRISKISKEELHEFWLQITDQSFDARLQIFFDMWVYESFFPSFSLILWSLENGNGLVLYAINGQSRQSFSSSNKIQACRDVL